MLWRMDRAPVELQLACYASATADRVLAEHHAVLERFDGERTQVKELVVQCAKRQAIGLDVWTTDVMPLNVRCLQPGWREPDAKVKSADTGPVLVRAQHPLPEGGIPATALRVCVASCGRRCLTHFARPVEVQAQAGHDVAMQGQREVGIQHAGGHGLHQARHVAQGVVDFDGEAALDVVHAQFGQAGGRASGALENLARPTQLPERAVSVGGQMPERVVPRLGGAARAEFRE